jgi:hypothetical protein
VKKKQDLLLVLNPRRIEECLASYRGLEIDRLWIRNMGTIAIEEAWPEIMSMTAGYERLLLVSDDAIVRQPAVDAVLDLMDSHPVANGYANLDVRDMRVTINKAPIGEISVAHDYDFWTLGEALASPEPQMETSVLCFALTGMSRDMWIRFPFQTELGSDFGLSKRLTEAEIPMMVAREGFIWHTKETWNYPDEAPSRRLLVDVEPPGLELERA